MRKVPGRNLNALTDPLRLQWGRNLTVAEGVMRRAALSYSKQRLQWGRNLTVAEGHVFAQRIPHKTVLQWGRNLTVAEGPSAGRMNRRR